MYARTVTAPPLPPLTALRAFEAAARHLSFTRAGAELSVTQTAISHQIRQLEEHLGQVLFRRTPRALTLTPDGAAWAGELRPLFARLAEVNRRLRTPAPAGRPVVAVSVLPSFGTRWLVPRLGRFLARHPGVDVRISSSSHLVDFAVEPIDLGVRWGDGSYPGLVVDKLADDELVVVCAPALRARRALTSVDDLRRHVLLHDDDPEAWPRWFAAHHVRDAGAARGIVLTDSSMLVAAAVEAQGVGLARRSLAMDELAAGRLIQPFPRVKPLPLERAYYVAAPRRNLARPEVQAFRAWLLEEAAALRQ
jgi:LysR family glycine cleavage system transcriptional activator